MNTRFSDALIARKKAGFIPVIPDIKCISPRDGDLLFGRDPVIIAKQLVEAGAPALSVVTEQKNFGGSIVLLKSIAEETSVPILRKDFIKSIDDLKITRDSGAHAILLICSMLPFYLLTKLYEEASKLGLEPLVETRTREELAFASKLGAKLVGINNRNILELEKDDGTVSATELLAAYVPEGALLISESSLKTQSEVRAAINAGADAVLIGTAILQAENLYSFYKTVSKGTGDCF
ncbi:MAG: indole-3-glycerol-phosphate synthase [Clostridiaceae bacterium]|jgi:indole-3-glycerol phosphate synthase|nr:indole-3-glycerol-phosphate synthase [Clostridiaceae bacterium]